MHRANCVGECAGCLPSYEQLQASEKEAWRLLKERGDMILKLQARVKELEAELSAKHTALCYAEEIKKHVISQVSALNSLEEENAKLRKVVDAANAMKHQLDSREHFQSALLDALACVAAVSKKNAAVNSKEV